MRNNKLVIVGAIIALATVAASCGDSSSSTAPATTTTAAAVSTTDASVEGVIYVTANDTKGIDAEMSYDVSAITVKAGEVTFVLDNLGTVEHEVVVFKTDTPFDQLVLKSNDRLDEADSVGEIAETPAGESDSITLTLAPGNYVLACNIAGHYRMGMTAALTVTA